tara:strand:- start:159 stop:404 length:246 start_codon:yes stop_codon:yes gene_type:complete
MRNEPESCECTTVAVWHAGSFSHREIAIICDDCRIEEEQSKAEAAGDRDLDEIPWDYLPEMDRLDTACLIILPLLSTGLIA